MNYANSSSDYNYPLIRIFHYSYEINHTYQISYDSRVNKISHIDYLEIRQSAFLNNWKSPKNFFDGTSQAWTHQTLQRTFKGTTIEHDGKEIPIEPVIEIYGAVPPDNTGVFDFDIKNIVVYDETNKKYLPSISDNAKAGTTLVVGDSDSTVTAVWEPITYTNTIWHWAGGFKYGEGNSAGKESYCLKKDVFANKYNEKYILDSSKATAIPNGFALGSIGSSSIDGEWTYYKMPLSVTQKAEEMLFQYDYNPITYTITYNLNGGTLPKENPSTYNVLYGVDFTNEPTKEGYKFLGWYINGKKVTGINVGCNATFSSADDLYAKLATRDTGNKTVTAMWEPITYTVKYHGNNSDGGTMADSIFCYDNINHAGENLIETSDKELSGHWGAGGDGNEFLRTPYDLSPIIDKYGQYNYLLKFDAYSPIEGQLLIYCQNGSGSKYGFNKYINVTTG